MKDSLHIVFNDDFVVSVTDFTLFYSYIDVTRPPRSQSGAIFCHPNHHCVVFKSPRQLWKKPTEIYFFVSNTLWIMHLEPI